MLSDHASLLASLLCRRGPIRRRSVVGSVCCPSRKRITRQNLQDRQNQGIAPPSQ